VERCKAVVCFLHMGWPRDIACCNLVSPGLLVATYLAARNI
jgi:hypothetical protein